MYLLSCQMKQSYSSNFRIELCMKSAICFGSARLLLRPSGQSKTKIHLSQLLNLYWLYWIYIDYTVYTNIYIYIFFFYTPLHPVCVIDVCVILSGNADPVNWIHSTKKTQKRGWDRVNIEIWIVNAWYHRMFHAIILPLAPCRKHAFKMQFRGFD